MDNSARLDIINPIADVNLIIKKIQNNCHRTLNSSKECFPYVESYAYKHIPENKSFSIIDGSFGIRGNNGYENHSHESTLKHSDGKFTVKGMFQTKRKNFQSLQSCFKIYKSKRNQESVKQMRSFDASWTDIVKKTNIILNDKQKIQKIQKSSRRRFSTYRYSRKTPSPTPIIDQKTDSSYLMSKSSKLHTKHQKCNHRKINSTETSTHEKNSDFKPAISIETKILPKKINEFWH
ncbi:unnamed protein product [Blepharisma stoltei]|uniref:Uncharacterized protein n=1 Tax=Blepharisma stoltei TaxID=1481888 RepID=A0AAU9IVL6_9CILI|nr:unnamed protein product [Blepharisma stoltei]